LRESRGEHTTSTELHVVIEFESVVVWLGVTVVSGEVITVIITVLLRSLTFVDSFIDRLAVQLTDATLSRTYSSMNIITRTLA
jgi:hypothetical protein